VLCGSAVVAALTIRWVERWTGSDRVGEAEDPLLTECLRLLETEDQELVRRARSFLIRAQQFTGDPRIANGLARLSTLLLQLPDEQADLLVARCLDMLHTGKQPELVDSILRRCAGRPGLTKVTAWRESRPGKPR